MSNFTIRVELHSATESDYTTLHEAMKEEGFSRRIKKGDGPSFHLPTAEYSKKGKFTAVAILNRAKKAATTTGKKFGILVTKSEEARKWFGLEEVE
jgi:hypothetical protein